MTDKITDMIVQKLYGDDESTMKVWLDDIRKPPDTTWEWVSTWQQVIYLIEKHPYDKPALMSFDHDLGLTIDGEYETDGYEILKWISTVHPEWYPRVVECHSANPVGKANILEWDKWWMRHNGPRDSTSC